MKTDPMPRAEAEELYGTLSREADKRRRSREMRRITTTGAAILLVVSSLLWAGWSLRDLASGSRAPAGAAKERGNYAFTDFEVKRSIDPRTKEPIPNGWTVTARESWSPIDVYPGGHNCRATAFDDSGGPVTTSSFRYGSNTPSTRTQVLGVRGARPATATVRCDPNRLDSPVAYEISGERVAGTFAWRDHVSGVEVRFDVAWPVTPPRYPGVNACTVTLTRPTGAVVARERFDLSVGRGWVTQRVWRSDFSDPSAVDDAAGLSADVQCHPFSSLDVSRIQWIRAIRDTGATCGGERANVFPTPGDYWVIGTTGDDHAIVPSGHGYMSNGGTDLVCTGSGGSAAVIHSDDPGPQTIPDPLPPPPSPPMGTQSP